MDAFVISISSAARDCYNAERVWVEMALHIRNEDELAVQRYARREAYYRTLREQAQRRLTRSPA